MNNNQPIFGWSAVWASYGWKSFLKDSAIPTTVSLFLCYLIKANDANIYDQLKNLLNLGISIVPAMVALILAAYTIILSFIMGDKVSEIRQTVAGKKLIQNLNSSFASCLFVSTISIIALIIVSCICNMKIEITQPEYVNYPVFFFVCYLLIYSVSILIGVVIDIFNSGQTTLLD